MRLSPTLFAYVVVLVMVLIKFTDWFVPHHDLSARGCSVSYVYDGDTVALTCDGQERTARLVGFDTPETKSPGCAAEAALGAQATTRLRALVAAGRVTLDGQGSDKYGRLLVRMTVGGQDVADTLIDEGLAVAYDGGTRLNWCRRLRAAG